jgi:hypothetical protein
MSTQPPQLGKHNRNHHARSYRSFLKRYTNRAHRRAAKRDPETAPKQRRWSGYDD